MENPVYKIISSGKPFVYFHTFLFDRNTINLAKQAGKSFELDVSMDRDGNLFAGHPYEFYEFKQIPFPHNLPFENIVDEIKNTNLYFVLDCKDVRALPRVEQIIKAYGSERTLFHSWITAFEFKPYAPQIVIEPHWRYEDLPFEAVLSLKKSTGVPVISSMRGLTQERLDNEPEIVERVIEIAAGKIEAVNFNLPGNKAPSAAIMQRLLDNGLLTWLNVDLVPAKELPPVYIGISDYLRNVTNPKDFN